jgi:hypothetical protein
MNSVLLDDRNVSEISCYRPEVGFHWWQRVFGNRLTEFSGYGIQTSARLRASGFGTERRESYGGNYSTVKSAQRLSATLSTRPRGRMRAIDM